METGTIESGIDFDLTDSSNPPFPEIPQSISIRGMHKRTILLDPRRIKPLKGQPRDELNPGFDQKSLLDLGTSIKTAGQQQAVKVCVSTDSNFDAQLIDGERRLRSTTLVGIMIWCEVDESVSDKDEEILYFRSVVSNFQREDHTSIEIAHALKKLIEDFKLPVTQVAKSLGHPTSWVYTQLGLLKLSPEVQKLLVTPPEKDSERAGDGNGRRRETLLSRVIGSMLIGLPEEEQSTLAHKIVDQNMNDTEARRYIHCYKREAGAEITGTSNRPINRFRTLKTLSDNSIHKFGMYLDMTPKEIQAMVETHEECDRIELAKKIYHLASCLNDIGRLVSGKKLNPLP